MGPTWLTPFFVWVWETLADGPALATALYTKLGAGA